LIEKLKCAVIKEQCAVQINTRESLPDEITVTGSTSALNAVAYSCQISRSADFAEEMISRFVPIDSQLTSAPCGELMIGWKRQYFDLGSKQWTPTPMRRTACECISEYGRRMTFVQVSKKRTVVLPRREAIYVAASLANVRIVSYDEGTQTLLVPAQAPLPEACARLACVSSGNIGSFSGGIISYSPVPQRIARLVLASIGQFFP